jgi:spore germination cell wall hydrolase CwlJ-like protein
MRTMKRLHQIIVTVALTVTVATRLGHAETQYLTISALDWQASTTMKKVADDQQLAQTLNRNDLWPQPENYHDTDKKTKPDNREVDCLAHNIYYEAGHEPTEGKIAVGLVTLNRVSDHRFPKTICAVVRQKTAGTCQFSWNCLRLRAPNYHDKIWQDSMRIAHELLRGDDKHDVYRIKYSSVMYFHNKKIKTDWKHRMTPINSPGHNVFYRGRL